MVQSAARHVLRARSVLPTVPVSPATALPVTTPWGVPATAQHVLLVPTAAPLLPHLCSVTQDITHQQLVCAVICLHFLWEIMFSLNLEERVGTWSGTGGVGYLYHVYDHHIGMKFMSCCLRDQFDMVN